MKLLRLSLISIAGCLIGLAILVTMGVYSLSQMQDRQGEIADYGIALNTALQEVVSQRQEEIFGRADGSPSVSPPPRGSSEPSASLPSV